MKQTPLINHLPLIKKGKVREIYEVDDKTWLLVATNHVSAFDVVLPDIIPKKGAVLTQMSKRWFDWFGGDVKNHLSNKYTLDELKIDLELQAQCMLVEKLEVLPIEAIVRGYLAGSAYNHYQKTGFLFDVELPKGLSLGAKLNTPLFTPSTKAPLGEHDENINFSEMVKIIGPSKAQSVHDISLMLYRKAHDYASSKQIVIMDTKFEFGLDVQGNVVLIDELFTPDSSRFCFKEDHEKGVLESFDKQFIRDYLNSIGWDKKTPAPVLSDQVIKESIRRYQVIFDRLFS